MAAILATGMGPAAGSEPAINGSTPEAYERSIAAMVDGMTPADRQTFSKGLTALAVQLYPPATGAEGMTALAFLPAALEAAPRTLDGLTLPEIMAEGERQNREASEAQEERAMEEARRARAEAEAEAERAEAERAAEEARRAALENRTDVD